MQVIRGLHTGYCNHWNYWVHQLNTQCRPGLSVSVCVCLCVCVCVIVYVCTCMCGHACMHAGMYVCICICVLYYGMTIPTPIGWFSFCQDVRTRMVGLQGDRGSWHIWRQPTPQYYHCVSLAPRKPMTVLTGRCGRC